MKKIQYAITSFFCILSVILLSSCGANNPNTPTTSQLNNTNAGNNTTISAYQSTVHGNTLTHLAISYLLSSNNPGNLSAKQRKLLQDYRNQIETGSIEEDHPDYRPLNHFWDPEYDRFLTDMGNTEYAQGVSLPGSLSGIKAIDWARYGPMKTVNDYAYEEGTKKYIIVIPLYNPNNNYSSSDMDTSMSILGHVLHVFQDMTSPPHVRNDAHLTNITGNAILGMGGLSGYEDVTQSYVPDTNLITFENITTDDILWGKFAQLAKDTHYNFFSESTIPTANQAKWRFFKSPTLPIGTMEGYISAQGLTFNPLIKVTMNYRTKQIEYSIDDEINRSYAKVLMPEAISYTAGVIKYFLSLKGNGTITIDSPSDNTTVSTPDVDISGSLTYYAASAAVYYRLASSTDLSRTKIVVPVVFANGKYTFTATVPLVPGANTIDVEAYNENVNYTSDRITVTYSPSNPAGGATPPQSGGNGNNGGGTPPVYHLSPNGIPGVMSPDVGALLFNNPSSVPCILSSPYINPNANSLNRKPFTQLCGNYNQYALFQLSYWIVYKDTGARMYVLDNGNPMYTSQFIGNPNSDPNKPSVWGLYNPSMNSFSNPAAWSQLDQPTLTPRTVPCNDPCFQGIPSLPDDLFTGNGLKPGDYLDPNGNLWRKDATGNVTQI